MAAMSLFETQDEVKTPELTPGEKLLEVHDRLCEEYGCPIPYFHNLDPLDELISSLLSHRTKNADSSRAFQQLKAKFPKWEMVYRAPVAEIEALIAPVTWPEQKAPRILQVLRDVYEQRGIFSLDFLERMDVKAAREWLEQLPGVGPKTSAAVLSFSKLHMRALPVDSHHHRVAARLELIPKNLAVGPSHAVLEAMLPPEWDAQKVYDNHEVLMIHGQRVCFYSAPNCKGCVLLDLCPTGQSRLSGAAKLAAPLPA